MANIYHYTYLITNLKPATTHQYYIGVKSCDVPPEENTDYLGSSSTLDKAIKIEGIVNFEKVIIDKFSSREEAEKHENELHVAHNAAQNPIFYNKKNGTVGFHTTPESTQNQKNTVNSPKYKKTTGALAIQKQKVTKSSKLWKETKGKDQARRIKEKYNDTAWKTAKANCQAKTLNNPAWQVTSGKEKSRKIKETVNDPHWQSTVGVAGIQKYKETVNDPHWQETTGKEKIQKYKDAVTDSEWKETVGLKKKRKEKLTKSDPRWINNNTYTCPHCNKSILSRGNLSQHLKGKH